MDKPKLVVNNSNPMRQDLDWVLWNEPWTLDIDELARIMEERAMPIEEQLYIYGLFCKPGAAESPDVMWLQGILWGDDAMVKRAREAMAATRRSRFTAIASSQEHPAQPLGGDGA
ncbi:MAG: hypothetical protein N2483_09170 [Burkholderiaceae bacterium]|nr:hypothetical protein [Burkholderiaceae bacterium]